MTRKIAVSGQPVWDHAISDIPETGLTLERDASADELLEIARALDLIACTTLKAAYSIVPMSGGRYRLHGRLQAAISQACVVTLDPVDSTVEETFAATFWPEKDVPRPRGGEIDIDEEADPEPIVAGQLAVGRVVFESLAAAIDHFPRRPDAELDRRSSGASERAEGTPEGPFAVLAGIKSKA
jgi:Large ribosomal RNA subunit accumulation protein YceD